MAISMAILACFPIREERSTTAPMLPKKWCFNALSSATVVLVVIVITMVSKDAELRRGLGACILHVRLKFEAILVRL